MDNSLKNLIHEELSKLRLHIDSLKARDEVEIIMKLPAFTIPRLTMRAIRPMNLNFDKNVLNQNLAFQSN